MTKLNVNCTNMRWKLTYPAITATFRRQELLTVTDTVVPTGMDVTSNRPGTGSSMNSTK